MSRMVLIFVLAFAVVATAVFLRDKLFAGTAEVQTVQPFSAVIRQTVIANGSIVPREEVMVKPQISGVVSKLLVDTGDVVKVGDLLAIVEPQPDPEEVNQAAQQLREAEIRLAHARRELARGEKVIPAGGMTRSELKKLQLDVAIGQVSLDSAKRLVEIVQTGASQELNSNASEVRATIAGTILERPVELGSFVIETNTFNEGTTIVKIAEMAELIFEGEVGEEDAGKLEPGMPVTLEIGAFPNQSVEAVLSMVAPQSSQRNIRGGTHLENTTLSSFEIRADINADQSVPKLRSGYSATATAIIHQVETKTAIAERHVQLIDGATYVEVQKAGGAIETTAVELGLSDGLNVAVLKGIDETTKVVVTAQ